MPDEENKKELIQLKSKLLKQLRSGKLCLPNEEKNTELGQPRSGLLKQLRGGILYMLAQRRKQDKRRTAE